MRPRTVARAGILLFAAVVACVLGFRARVSPVEAVEAPATVATLARTDAPDFTLFGVKWTDRKVVDVYYTWAGGPCAVQGVADFSGPASTIAPEIAVTQLRSALNDINAGLRGALTLNLAGETTRAELCGQDTAKAIVVGWGAIGDPTSTGRAYYSATKGASNPESVQFGRVFIRNDRDFSCLEGETYRELRHVMIHEILHTLGVDHSADPAAIMTPNNILCLSATTLQADDLAALAALYPPPSAPSTPPGPSGNEPSTPLPLPTVGVGLGLFAAAPSFSAGGQALVVFGGGSVAQLEVAAKAAGATGVWAQQANGTYRLLVIGGPTFVNDGFRAAFAAGFGAAAAITLTR